MTKKDNDILARDLVLAAFIVMKRQYESRDAGRAGKLQMFLNIHAGTHGDVQNIVAILNNPKSTVKLSEDQKRIYQRALDIVESLEVIEIGWVEPTILPENILAKTTNESVLSPEQVAETNTMIEAAMMQEHPPTEQPKAKPGRKAKNPIEAATTNAKKKGKACCN